MFSVMSTAGHACHCKHTCRSSCAQSPPCCGTFGGRGTSLLCAGLKNLQKVCLADSALMRSSQHSKTPGLSLRSESLQPGGSRGLKFRFELVDALAPPKAAFKCLLSCREASPTLGRH